MGLSLSRQQADAIDAVGRWLRAWASGDRSRPSFYLAGWAGTGKTTIAKGIASLVDKPVVFASYTGKAALVLRSKGCDGARTIHQLIYDVQGGDDGDPDARRRQALLVEMHLVLLQAERDGDQALAATTRAAITAAESEPAAAKARSRGSRLRCSLKVDSDVRYAGLVIVDECSMADERVGRDLESYGTPVLALGDPAQLPPVMGGGYWTGRDPDFLLDEVHRQAADSPVLRLATLVRQGRSLPRGELGGPGGGTRVVGRDRDDLLALATRADQVIVGRNATRHATNARYRRHLGLDSPMPVPGDRLVCLRNDHQAGLLNGSLWRCAAAGPDDGEQLDMTVLPEGETGAVPLDVRAHVLPFLGRDDDLRARPSWERRAAQEFDYGYALTCHKAQGSPWSTGYVLDESASFRKDAQRWKYTAITRFADAVTVVEP